MKVVSKSYNVLSVIIDTAITPDTPTVIGTNDDYLMIKRCTKKSGILIGEVTIGGNTIKGAMNVNPWTAADKLECSVLTNIQNGLTAIIVTLEPSDDGMKATFDITAFE